MIYILYIKLNKRDIEKFSKKCNITKIQNTNKYLYKPSITFVIKNLLKAMLLILAIPFLWVIIPFVYLSIGIASIIERIVDDISTHVIRDMYKEIFFEIKLNLKHCKNHIIEEVD